MLSLKIIFLGLWLVGFGTMAWLWFEIYRHLPPGPGAVGVDLIYLVTLRSPLWWTGAAVCFALGFVIVRSWVVPLGVWIALVTTGLVPAGCLTLFIVILIKMKQASQGHL